MQYSIEKTQKSTKPTYQGNNQDKQQKKKQEKLLAEKRKNKRDWE